AECGGLVPRSRRVHASNDAAPARFMAYWHDSLSTRYSWQLPCLLPGGMVTAMTRPAEINAEIARRVGRDRREQGMSRPALARLSGIAERTLARRESGMSAWTTDELAAIATALRVDVSTLWVAPTLAVSA